jgi:hypothetical protein
MGLSAFNIYQRDSEQQGKKTKSSYDQLPEEKKRKYEEVI